MAGEKKFGTSMFGFKRADVNAYIERIIREFDQRLKEKDDENSALKSQVKELRVKYDQISHDAEALIKEKEKIAGVLLQAQETAEIMMSEAKDKAIKEKNRLDQLLESEREKFVDMKRELKELRRQIRGMLLNYEQQLDEAVAGIEKREEPYLEAAAAEEEEDGYTDSENMIPLQQATE